jgi:hypothetical protein
MGHIGRVIARMAISATPNAPIGRLRRPALMAAKE